MGYWTRTPSRCVLPFARLTLSAQMNDLDSNPQPPDPKSDCFPACGGPHQGDVRWEVWREGGENAGGGVPTVVDAARGYRRRLV